MVEVKISMLMALYGGTVITKALTAKWHRSCRFVEPHPSRGGSMEDIK